MKAKREVYLILVAASLRYSEIRAGERKRHKRQKTSVPVNLSDSKLRRRGVIFFNYSHPLRKIFSEGRKPG
ncbi:phage integrase Arm DNA-binding domain-containing protein [Candidatus Pacearchaeota archaeon]|nr:phage integrase Arm DNA-binding domain-containing protein [Candidatus Pacearchaeota archaeon]